MQSTNRRCSVYTLVAITYIECSTEHSETEHIEETNSHYNYMFLYIETICLILWKVYDGRCTQNRKDDKAGFVMMQNSENAFTMLV